jgi:hypothetical protein
MFCYVISSSPPIHANVFPTFPISHRVYQSTDRLLFFLHYMFLKSVMFVGGPNTRTDFHLDESSEFFFQMRGNMQLPTIQRGKRVHVDIKEGQV